MDSLTHVVLGGCIGEAMLGQRIGKKAILMGAMAQSLPDIDFVASFWMSGADDLLAHRGITHSFLFLLLVSPLFAILSNKTVKPSAGVGIWTLFFMIEIGVHLFLDAFNNYGVGWFEPFSDYRVSFNTIYVADPLLSILPAISFIALLLTRAKTIYRHKWWKIAIVGCSFYLLVCTINKQVVDRSVRKAFTRQSIPGNHYFTTPAPLQSFLWMVVSGNQDGFNVAYRSVFDRSDTIAFTYFPRNENLLATLRDTEEVNKLKKFSQGFYTIEQINDTLIFNDLRFGQIVGWHDPQGKFVFHYYLRHPENNALVVQRGRFARWDEEVFRSFLRRIRGN